MNTTYVAFIGALLLIVAGALWYTRSDDASMPADTGLVRYAYTCDRDMAFMLSLSGDMRAITISPIAGVAYPPLSTLTDSPTDTGRRYRNADFEFHGVGESVTLYDVVKGETYTCEPHAKPNEAPFDWGKNRDEEPTPGTTVTVTAKVGVPVEALGESIIVRRVIEDSRCPADVQCIQAGTVRIDTTIRGDMGDGQVVLELGKIGTSEVNTFVFMSASPAPRSGSEISEKDYEFVIEVTRRGA